MRWTTRLAAWLFVLAVMAAPWADVLWGWRWT